MQASELFATAIVRWGAESQLLMGCEECGELSVAILHYLRGRGDLEHIAEEAADVELMLEQAKALFGAAFANRVREWRAMKLTRLESLLSEPATTGGNQ